MKTILALTIAGMLAAPLVAAPAYRKPTKSQAAAVRLAPGLTGADLERIRIGNQAGILKIFARDERTTKFLKGSESWNGGGIDVRQWAPVKPADRDAILKTLEVKDPEALALSLMRSYSRISRVHAVALLGTLAVPGAETTPLSAATQVKVREFLRTRLQPPEDAAARRQAVLALAIHPTTDQQIAQAMINFLRRDHNAWNTFGVVQYFEYHAKTLAALPQAAALATSIAATGSPHAQQILRNLTAAAPPAPEPSPSVTPAPPPGSPAQPR